MKRQEKVLSKKGKTSCAHRVRECDKFGEFVCRSTLWLFKDLVERGSEAEGIAGPEWSCLV